MKRLVVGNVYVHTAESDVINCYTKELCVHIHFKLLVSSFAILLSIAIQETYLQKSKHKIPEYVESVYIYVCVIFNTVLDVL